MDSYLDLLPKELMMELAYFLPYSLMEIICQSKRKFLCTDRQFLNNYLVRRKSMTFIELEQIANDRNLPITLLYDAPVELLLELEININKSYNNTLNIAGQYDYLPIFKYILDTTDQPMKTQYPHLSQVIYALIRDNASNIIIYLLDTYGDILLDRSKYGILYRIVQNNNVPLLAYVIEQLNYDKIPNIDNILSFALSLKQKEALIYLLQHVKFSKKAKTDALKNVRYNEIADILRKYDT